MRSRANGSPPLCSGYASSDGSRIAPSRSNIAGPRDARSASPRSRPSSSGLRSMSFSPGTVLEMGDVLTTARTLGLDVVTLEIRRAEDIAPAFEALKGRADALYVCNDPLVNTNRVRINTSALGARLPTVYNWREDVEAGGLMSYGTNFPDTFRRSAELIDKVLRGAKPADIPVEQPTKFDLTINLTTAKALGLDLPPSVLARADAVIE